MPSMSLLAPIVCGLLCLLILLVTWGRHARGHGARAMLRGTGLVLVVVGLYLTHLADLAANGIRSIIDWAQRTQMGTRLTLGFAVAGVGLLLFIIGSLLHRRDRDELRAVRQGRKGNQAAVAAPAGPTGRAAKAPASSSEDDEVEAILRSRGIN